MKTLVKNRKRLIKLTPFTISANEKCLFTKQLDFDMKIPKGCRLVVVQKRITDDYFEFTLYRDEEHSANVAKQQEEFGFVPPSTPIESIEDQAKWQGYLGK